MARVSSPFKELMMSHGIGVGRLVVESEVSKALICQMRKGYEPSEETLGKVARAMKLTPGYVLRVIRGRRGGNGR